MVPAVATRANVLTKLVPWRLVVPVDAATTVIMLLILMMIKLERLEATVVRPDRNSDLKIEKLGTFEIQRL
jgi:hypothetical protein